MKTQIYAAPAVKGLMFNKPIKSLLSGMTVVFEHEDLQMFGLKLKGLAQAKIKKKSVILFRVLNMTI